MSLSIWVKGRLLALARALARLAAREDAAEEEKSERARHRRTAAIDALKPEHGADTPNSDC